LFDDSILQLTSSERGNRRRCDRYDVTLPISVQPVSDELAPVGERLETITADLSRSGVRFFCSKAVLDRQAIVTFAMPSGEVISVLAELVRCRRIGAMFEIAARFVRKLS
jgi:hypothetical protein